MDILCNPSDAPELLRALRPARRLDGTYGAVPASRLRTLSVKLPESSSCTAEEADGLVRMLFSVMACRAEMGQPLEQLVVTECLTERPSFESAFSNNRDALSVLETPPCACDDHDVLLFEDEE